MHKMTLSWPGALYGAPKVTPQSNHQTLRKQVSKDNLALLRTLPLLQQLREEDLRILMTESHHRVFDAGHMIFYQGDVGTTCHILLEGRVRVYVLGEDGRELVMDILGPGDIVGEMALFEGRPRSANVEALSETRTLELDQNTLLRCLRRSPAMAMGLLRAMSTRLRNTTEDAERVTSLPVAERLLCRLQQLAARSGRRVADGVCIMPPMTQQELAELVWTSRESVNRALGRLRDKGQLRLENGWIVILDRAMRKASNV